MQAENLACRVAQSHFSRELPMPIGRAPLIFATWPAIAPATFAAADTSTVSPWRIAARPSSPRAVDAGDWHGCSAQAWWPSETQISRMPHSRTTCCPTAKTSWRDSSTSQTPNAGTTSPSRGPVLGRGALPDGTQVNGSTASQRARQSIPPLVRRGTSPGTTSKSPAVAGVRLILTSRLRMDPPLLLSLGLRRLAPRGVLLIRGVDLLLDLCLGLLRLLGLLRSGGAACGGGGTGLDQAAAGERK